MLLEIPEAKPHYLLVVDRQGALDTLEVQVEIEDAYFSDEMGQIKALTAKIKKRIEAVLGISVKLTLLESNTLERSEGKTQRVLDKRHI